ncbi:autophagy-related protein 13b-like [Populus alba x Populus x berolinensis]|uniref:Autophagy-related protein 13b-like n=1 Tax=Populus alba x Populus x berolinensis TaxID=444605 RepID=A0AAD6L6V1_9ROSI|nr:autophagy-related protein 13b-like [Populus alba x Populus x berolinensis]
MASSNNSTDTEAAEMEQIITEFFPKSLQIILESRSPFMSSRNYSGEQMVSLSPSSSSSSSPSVRPRDKWFNLALRECPAALENLDLWHQSYMEPMIVDVILVQVPPGRWDPVNYPPRREPVRNFPTKDRYPFHWNSDEEELGCEGKIEKIVERWEVRYEGRKSRDSGTGSRKLSNTFQTCYMKSILLFRSLYATVRLLPAYKIFRDLNSSGEIRAYTLTHRVSSFVEPFTRKEEAEMQRFVFTPVDTSWGRLCLSVLYHSSLSDVRSESSTPMSPQFIPDYVGSPLAEPVKRFPSLPVSQGSLSSLPFSRQHNKALPPSFSFSPSPNRSGKHGSISNPSSCRFQPSSLPPHPPEVSSVHEKNTSFDEHYPSPSYTPSPSPSPPICIPESHLSTVVLQSESAPFSIPATKHASSPLLSNKQNLPPSPPLKATTSCNPKTDESTGLVHPRAADEKLFSPGKDDIRKYASMKTLSNSSPRISFSRTSSRPETSDKKGHLSDPLEPGGLFPIKKSQDAAVGAPVHTLKKPPPLCKDLSGSAGLPPDSRSKMWSCNLQEYNPISVAPAGQQAAASGVASSGLIASKTAADALEELKRYEEIKDSLLSQAGRSNA